MSIPSPILESAYIILFSGSSKPSLCRQDKSREPMLILFIVVSIVVLVMMMLMMKHHDDKIDYLSFSPLLRWPFAP